MRLTPEILKDATVQAEQIYKTLPDGRALYSLAIRLAQQCNTLCMQAEMKMEDALLVQIAALFLFIDRLKQGESRTTDARNAVIEFCKSSDIDEDIQQQIEDCIKAVEPPQMPMTQGGQVLCDALNSFLVEKGRDINEEIQPPVQVLLFDLKDENPFSRYFHYLETQNFFTPEARKLFDKPKQKKIAALKEKIAGLEIKTAAPAGEGDLWQGDSSFEKPRLERGTETLFRIASREHVELNALVHQKSGFLSSTNAIILSVVGSVLLTKLNEYPQYIIPTFMLMITCVSTIYFATLATKPTVVGNVNVSDFRRDDQNILFFGHYTHMPWPEYRKSLRSIVTDTSDLFDSLAKNYYYQGVVLQKKYKLLAVAYRIFLTGIVLSVLAYIVSFLVYYFFY